MGNRCGLDGDDLSRWSPGLVEDNDLDSAGIRLKSQLIVYACDYLLIRIN
jgi:hypothetical protein